MPRSTIVAGIEAMRAMGEDTGFAALDPDDIPFACPDEWVTTAFTSAAHTDAKLAAMRDRVRV